MNWQNRTPEERKASAAKGVATARRNREAIGRAIAECQADAFARSWGMKNEIEELERKLASLRTMETMSNLAQTLTCKALLSEAQILEAAQFCVSTSGVYFLVEKQHVVYVGQSVNVHARIAAHRIDKTFSKFAYVLCDVAMLDRLESLYIHVLRPVLNGNRTASAKTAPIEMSKLLCMV